MRGLRVKKGFGVLLVKNEGAGFMEQPHKQEAS